MRRWLVILFATVGALGGTTPQARAGTYYVYACSSYGNGAPAFAPYSNADHLNTAQGCMEPAPGGGYKSLEINNPNYAPVLHGYGANWTAYSPSPAISIIGAYTPVNTVFVDCYLHGDGFTAEFLWSSGTQAIDHVNYCNSSGYGYGTGISTSFAPSSYFGFGAGCWLAPSCSTSSNVGAVLGVQGIRLTVEEDSAPSVSAVGSNNLWYQGGNWVRGGGWPVAFTSSDPSGVCLTVLAVNGQWTKLDYSTATADSSRFTQCFPADTVSDTFDTRNYANGPLSLVYAAVNAAQVWATPSQTVQIDNTPVTLSLSTPNDADPNAWVNHPVRVLADAAAGPSGVRSTSCSTNSGATYAYPSNGVALDGTGVWTVSCVSQNGAVDVNGQPGSSPPETVRVHIDETAPSIAFAPSDPSDPQAIVVNASDGQSGVASGQIQMRPASGGSWTVVPTRFDGSHLLARFDDASLTPGTWTIEATSCDNAGNCASTERRLALPVRVASVSSVGFEKAADIRRSCGHQHSARQRCRSIRRVTKRQIDTSFGSRATLYGTLSTAQGNPIAHASVDILAAPDNGFGQYSPVASVTTDPNGNWSATLPAGPSRLIAALYAGSPTIQPSDASATLIVPAAVKVLRVWPRHIDWGGKVHIKAQLLGGFLPAGGALVRLRLGLGRAKITYGVQEDVSGTGVFQVTNTFGDGPPSVVRHYWLQECTLPEGDYPFAPACGPRTRVVVGGP